MFSNLSNLFVKQYFSIREVIGSINRNEKGIVMVVDDNQRLLCTITDGDIRRAMLASDDLDSPVENILSRKRAESKDIPVTAPIDSPSFELLRIMREHYVKQIPLTDSEGCVVDLVTMTDLIPDAELPLQAVIMAGGYGKRLLPLTEKTPKPMLPVGDRPLLELTIAQLKQVGIRNINITTHFMSEKISNYFGSGDQFGIKLNYVSENEPLGTAGALGLMERPCQPLLVINGDILTGVNFKSMLEFHNEHKADITVAVRKYEIQVPYGVIECENHNISQLKEKPNFAFFVNAGIYLLNPDTHNFIPNGQHLDMTDLIQRMLKYGRSVVSFPIMEYWLDIGEHENYIQAQKDIKAGKIKI